MKMVILGMILGNILGALLMGNWGVTLIVGLGQLSAVLSLWMAGCLRT
jgi:hypothetical protein